MWHTNHVGDVADNTTLLVINAHELCQEVIPKQIQDKNWGHYERQTKTLRIMIFFKRANLSIKSPSFYGIQNMADTNNYLDTAAMKKEVKNKF